MALAGLGTVTTPAYSDFHRSHQDDGAGCTSFVL